MGKFRDYLNEARAMSVPTEYRIALGQLKRMYNPGEVLFLKELQKDVEMIAKKNHLEADKFLEFVKSQFKMNESLSKSEYKSKKEELIELLWKYDEGQGFDKKEDIYKQYKQEIDTIMLGKIKLDRALDLLGFKKDKVNDKLVKPIYDFLKSNLNESNIDEATMKFKVGDKVWKVVFKKGKYFPEERVIWKVNSAKNFYSLETLDGYNTGNYPAEYIYASQAEAKKGKFFDESDIDWNNPKDPYYYLGESAVGKPGRTTEKDAEEHINDELVAEFKKIIKKLGGKTVAKVLLDKLSTKPEIKDEIEHIEDIIDNSNY